MLDDGGMTRRQKTYDHRLRELVRRTRDLSIATSVGVPRSTAAGWLRDPGCPTVTLDVLSFNEQELQAEVVPTENLVQGPQGPFERAFEDGSVLPLAGPSLSSASSPDV